MKQKHTYTQATEGKKCHWGAFNVKEKLYNWAGAEEDSVELNKVTTCIHFREENRQQDEECLRSHVHVCVCSASFHWQNILCKHPWHRQLLLCGEKLSFSMGLKGEEKKPLTHRAVWFELGRFPSAQAVWKSWVLASGALPGCALVSHRLNLPSSQQQAANFPLAHCGLGSIQEWFTRLRILSHTLIALANPPSDETKPFRGTKNQFRIPQCRIWNLNN